MSKGRMRVSISHGVRGSEIDAAIPSRYHGLADTAARRIDALTILAFPDEQVVTSSDVARALKRVNRKSGTVVAFMGDATVEALAVLRSVAIRTFTLRSFGWTDDRYAAVR